MRGSLRQRGTNSWELRVYDGTDAATIAGRSLSGAIAGDDVSLTGGSARFADANAGPGKVVTGSGFGLAGADKGDYRLASSTLTTSADIARKPVTGSFGAADKVYDGSAAATRRGICLLRIPRHQQSKYALVNATCSRYVETRRW